MDENHQDKTKSKPIVTEDDLWLPPLTPKDQKKLKHFQKKPFAVKAGIKGKTLWDWMQLLLIPVILVIVGSYFSYQQTQTSLQVSQQQHQQDQANALDQQEATILQTYIDNIQDLLLNHNLLKSKPTDDVAILAEARTLTALEGLDPHRKGLLVDFIYHALLIGFRDISDNKTHDSIISPYHANLSGADLFRASLSGADLSFANLSGANLFRAFLSYANLMGATLSNAHLSRADLSRADLDDADLSRADLSFANLSGANLSSADLDNANLSHAELWHANLSWTDLSSVGGLTQQQLDQVASCKNTTLPLGLTCHYNL